MLALGRYRKVVDEAMVELTTIYAEHDVFDQTDEQRGQRASYYWSAYEAFGDERKAIAEATIVPSERFGGA